MSHHCKSKETLTNIVKFLNSTAGRDKVDIYNCMLI